MSKTCKWRSLDDSDWGMFRTQCGHDWEIGNKCDWAVCLKDLNRPECKWCGKEIVQCDDGGHESKDPYNITKIIRDRVELKMYPLSTLDIPFKDPDFGEAVCYTLEEEIMTSDGNKTDLSDWARLATDSYVNTKMEKARKKALKEIEKWVNIMRPVMGRSNDTGSRTDIPKRINSDLQVRDEDDRRLRGN